MIQSRTVLKVIDNSGAKYVRCLKVLKKKKVGYLGDLIVVSVLSLRRERGETNRRIAG
jgi:large subunit ribosomal protein L14